MAPPQTCLLRQCSEGCFLLVARSKNVAVFRCKTTTAVCLMSTNKNKTKITKWFSFLRLINIQISRYLFCCFILCQHQITISWKSKTRCSLGLWHRRHTTKLLRTSASKGQRQLRWKQLNNRMNPHGHHHLNAKFHLFHFAIVNV